MKFPASTRMGPERAVGNLPAYPYSPEIVGVHVQMRIFNLHFAATAEFTQVCVMYFALKITLLSQNLNLTQEN